MANVAILHPIDPAGHVPSGIDTFIRGILKFAPPDIAYTLYGASSDLAARPLGVATPLRLGSQLIHYWPIVSMNPTASRDLVPLTIRYMLALNRIRRSGALDRYDVLDFHRIEPSFLFSDARPKNVLLHQDMSVIRDANSDILWRHMPWLYEAIEKRAFAKMSRIFAVRQSAVRRYQQTYAALADRFTFIPTWVDSTVFLPSASESARQQVRGELRAQLSIPAQAELMVFVGRLDQQKDPLLLIDALQRCVEQSRDLYLAIVGDGALRASVEERIRVHHLESRVRLLGVRPPPEIAEILRAADVYVLCSAYEGMPIAVLEALACGLPVACTDVGEVRLVIHDGLNGFVSKARSAQSLQDAILKTLESADKLRGPPSIDAVKAFQPANVLENIYANHRTQKSIRTAA